MKNKQCHHEWEVINPKDYNLKERTSLAVINPMMCLYRCKHCGLRMWGLKGKGGKQ